ncbi:MAG TPA: porin family protein [Flavipsychrobacter sp.]|mgnify:CR=1 FL=1|nr:porin family protein [Flavipsychrobacter sp.]
MKKFLTIATGLFFAASINVNAQTKKRSNVEYMSLGPIVGFGHSWVSGKDNQDFKASVNLGIGLIYSKHEHWGFGADLAVSHEGFKMEDDLTNTELVVNPVYLRLTPKAYYFFGSYGNKIRPKVYAGPSLAYKVDERVSFNDERLNSDEVKAVFGKDIFDDADLGITAGAGLNVELKKGVWLNLDGNYYHGLLDVTDNGGANRNLRLNVGVLFGL